MRPVEFDSDGIMNGGFWHTREIPQWLAHHIHFSYLFPLVFQDTDVFVLSFFAHGLGTMNLFI
jgi:hypothetical protein